MGLVLVKSRAELENKEKNAFLEAAFGELFPREFYGTVFPDCEREYVAVIAEMKNSRGKPGTYKNIKGFDALMDIACSRSDVFVPPASFFHGCYRRATLENLFAFVVDLDYVSASAAGWLARKVKLLDAALRPTAIVNSGNGLHLYYVLSEPLACYHNRRRTIENISGALQQSWRSGLYKVDRNLTMIQGFRAPGSLDKDGRLVKAFLSGEKLSVERIADALGIKLWDARGEAQKRKRPDNLLLRPNGKRVFYEHCFLRVGDEVLIGHRYNALFALAIVAYKCRMGREKTMDDLEYLAELFNGRPGIRDVLKRSEVEKAMAGYSNKFVTVSAEVLERYFGFRFHRKMKKNGRKRGEHLSLARDARREKQKGKILANSQKITELLEQGHSKKEVANLMGMTLQNLYKTYKHILKKGAET